MTNHDELEQAGLNVDGVRDRLEAEHERDALAEFRRRRNLSETDAAEYALGVEVGAAWVREQAPAAELAIAWRLAARAGTSIEILPNLCAFLAREADLSRRGSRYARFDPQQHSASAYAAGVIDLAAAAWAVLRDQNPERAAELSSPYTPAARAAYIASLEDETGDRGSRMRRGA
jgi:hypothetical protein